MQDKSKWDYYRKLYDYWDFQKIIQNPYQFVKEYLQNGDKLEEELASNLEQVFSEKRIYHTISIFF